MDVVKKIMKTVRAFVVNVEIRLVDYRIKPSTFDKLDTKNIYNKKFKF